MPYRHEALFFASRETLLEAGVPWLQDGLDAGDVIALTCDAENNAALAAALSHHPAVRVLPQERIYHKAIDAVAFYHHLISTRSTPTTPGSGCSARSASAPAPAGAKSGGGSRRYATTRWRPCRCGACSPTTSPICHLRW